MKKVLLAIAVVIGAMQFSNAQISYGVKAGMNIDLNGEAAKEITMPTGFGLSTDSNTGYHAGAWVRFKLPLVGLYVRPEIIYTDLKSEYTVTATDPNNGNILGTADMSYSLTKVDVPVLLGLKFLKFGNVFLGPNIQYLTKSEFNSNAANYNDNTINEELSVGLVIGAGIEFWKLGLDARFESGFVYPSSTDLSSIGSAEDLVTALSTTLTNEKPNQLIIGLSYKF